MACQQELMALGKAYPRTCQDCGLGPCKNSVPQPARQEQEQEPVAWMVYTLDGKSVCVTDNPDDFTPAHKALPLHTIPPSRKWVGLTEEEKVNVAIACGCVDVAWMDFADAIEAKLREKNA